MTGNMIGRVFNNRYQITERIGIGGMAEVYRAQDNVLGRMVAVKVMLPQYAADPDFTRRFRQEAASAANLQSPYIVNVYDWGQDEGTYYIVMELVRGSDLKTAIKQRGAINQRKVAEIGSQVCQALSVAHGLDIIHRDIKPQNIMVQPDGNVKVMDFGIARAKNSTKEQTSSVLGTAHYISPEQAQGKELTAASDIYSLGIVLYESATGVLPFDGPDAVSVAMKQVQDLPAPPSDVKPDIDPDLEAIIMKALAKNPVDRFETAKEMRSALNDYLAGRPVLLADDGFTRAQTSVMRGVVPPVNRPVVDGTAVMPAIGNQSRVNQNTGAQQLYRSDNTKPKSKAKTIGIVVAILAVLAIAAGVAFGTGLFGQNDKNLIEVPGVTNQTVEEARTALVAAGLEVGDVKEQASDKVESGKVISQDPKAASKAKKGTKVNLTVSSGTEQVTVPDLTGMTADQARKALQTSGLKYTAGTADYSDSVDKDKVFSQDPVAGTKVGKDTTVTYYLSLGKEAGTVPNVVGESEGSAVTLLGNAGYYVTEETQSSDSVAAGNVISQTPNAGSSLAEGGTVHLVISSGKQASTYNISVSSNGGGAVSSSANSVKEGQSVTISIQPYGGYQVSSASGLSGVGASGGTFTITPTGDTSIYVEFVQTTASNPGGTTDNNQSGTTPGGNTQGGNGNGTATGTN